MEAIFSTSMRRPDDLDIYGMYGKMPNYHKVTIHPDVNIQYHLTGYGLYFEESLIRLLGEGIERYALMMASLLLRDQIRYASYNEIKESGEALPWDLINIFSDEDYEKLRPLHHIRKINEDSVIGWLSCPSLLEPDKKFWVPVQMLFPGYKVNSAVSEVRFNSGFSKGAAAHTNFKKAMLNAILESIEMDPFIVKWYTMKASPRVILDDYALVKNFPRFLGKDSQFEVLPLLLNLEDTPGYSFGVAMIHKKEEIPFIAFGTQLSLDPVKGLYRAMVEAGTITTIGDYGPIFIPDSYLKYPKEGPFMDLDKNVAYYLFPQEASLKRDIFKNLSSSPGIPRSGLKNLSTGDDAKDIQYLIRKLRTFSKYAIYVNITPPEVIRKGWHVVRVFVPECAGICLPGFPFSRHPRIIKYGGIKNSHPHPLP
jgi:thiazole/oxazole-forming peptide maturase SagD family component